MSGHVKYKRSGSPGEIGGESASHDDHQIMHLKRKKASQLAVMLATPSHAIESVCKVYSAELWKLIAVFLQFPKDVSSFFKCFPFAICSAFPACIF